MATPPDINRRARKILHAVVSEYLQSGEAVGSRTVTRRHDIGLSPATVRNVMADLEEMGLLAQPHTSAGRVPTPTGLRFFIDALLKVRGLSSKEKQEIRDRTGVDSLDIDEVVQRTSRMLSEITPYAGIVLAPRPELERFQHIEFVPLRGGRFLCVLVATNGRIENRPMQLDLEIDKAQLERIHGYLELLLRGMTLEEMRKRVLEQLGDEKNRYDETVAAALRLSQAALAVPGKGEEVIVSGQANLLSTNAAGEGDLSRMRDLLQALEDKETLVRLLDQAMGSSGIHVFLGAETAHEALGESSLVATPYGPDDHPLGAIAVIGPQRMNYGKVMSIVDFTAALVSRLAAGRLGD